MARMAEARQRSVKRVNVMPTLDPGGRPPVPASGRIAACAPSAGRPCTAQRGQQPRAPELLLFADTWDVRSESFSLAPRQHLHHSLCTRYVQLSLTRDETCEN